MSRPPRLLLSHSYYHVMTRGNNKMTVFRNVRDYTYYLHLIAKYKVDHPFDLYHYCLMPNHVHLLVKTNAATHFAIFMKKLNLAYFHHYRQCYGWVGHFWQDRYKSQPVGKDNYFIQCGKYIELNPMRKKLVQQPEEYSYSSYRYYAQGVANALISKDIFYEELGSNEQRRRERYRQTMVDEIVVGSYAKQIWGTQIQRKNEHKKITYHLDRADRSRPKATDY